jgi:hypothetical protein
LKLQVPLGSFADLPKQNGLSDEIDAASLADAWRLRQANHPTIQPASIGAEAAELLAQTVATEQFGPGDAAEQAARRAQDGEWQGVVAGGMTREGDMERYLKLVGGPAMIDARMQLRPRQAINPATLNEQLNQAIRLRDQRGREIAQLEASMREAPPEKRGGIVVKHADLTRECAVLNMRIEQIKQQVLDRQNPARPR